VTDRLCRSTHTTASFVSVETRDCNKERETSNEGLTVAGVISCDFDVTHLKVCV
jgi:hypothetical protein